MPDIPTLMHAVEQHQHASEALAHQYVHHSVETLRRLDGNGQVKRTEISDFDVFWINGSQIRRLVGKDGRPLSPDQQRHEEERVNKEIARARDRQNSAADHGSDPNAQDEVTVSRLLELGTFSQPRRVLLNNRPTIVVDFHGDPHAKTRSRLEKILADMEGTVWIDEQDQALRRSEGRFVRTFKLAGGLVADIHQGTEFQFDQQRINGEIWLPATIVASGAARLLLLFHFEGNVSVIASDYRKFRSTSTVLPAGQQTGDDTEAP